MEMDLDYFIQNAIDRECCSNVLELQELIVNTTTYLKNIDSLTNLKKLKICRLFTDESKEAKYIDYSKINNLKFLEQLYISNNDNIKELDLRGLNKLSRLFVLFNSNLERIVGLESLPNLKEIVIVGNKFNFIEDIALYLKNTRHAKLNILGIEFFCETIGFRKLGEKYRKLVENKYTYMTFAEKTSVGGLYFYSASMINNIYKKGLKILSTIIEDSMNDMKKIESVYKYIICNVEYDYDGLKERDNKLYKHFFSKAFEKDNGYRRINTSYNAIINKKAVCEGYANMLNFLLGILKIRSETIVCKLRSDNANFLNHNANKIFVNNDWYYFDVQKENNINKLKYFCQTKDDFLLTHELAQEEMKSEKGSKDAKNITRFNTK